LPPGPVSTSAYTSRELRPAAQHGLPEHLDDELPEQGLQELRLVLEPSSSQPAAQSAVLTQVRGGGEGTQRLTSGRTRRAPSRGVQRRRQAGAGGRPEAALSVVEAPIEGSVPGGGEQQGSSEMGTILARDFPPARGQTELPTSRRDPHAVE